MTRPPSWQPPDDLRVELDDAFRFTGPGGVHVSRSRLETLLAREHSRGFTEAVSLFTAGGYKVVRADEYELLQEIAADTTTNPFKRDTNG